MTRWREPRNVLNANHFGHRENGGLVIDLFWEHVDVEDHFRVEVEDKGVGVRLLLVDGARSDPGLPPSVRRCV
jgi:hypothetical protein